MAKVKYISILIGLLLLISACAPIDGLDQNGNSEETNAPVETTKAPVVTTAAPEPETLAQLSMTDAQWVKINADALNVRKDSNIDAERLTKIYDQQIYQVLDQSKDSDGLVWFKVEAADGIIGWISSDYCIIAATYDELVEDVEE